ncbi:hypothetical protein MUN88_14290 [Gracilibacillus caseinilyticus]|uniref:Uncharacterized protein n=1 Tax=Gracilibacillus caseinilyticus TaxID=2932256 RepID=A0ABY4ET35_9BACI|nr:hypothetical protein [Gracilibacillus caseinilyticus]UOQ47236.1 hypothetical protein MUN88_14290 [Gracilibacillus caseinilyticus]
MPGITASAAENGEGLFTEHIKGIEFEIPYDQSDVYIEKSETNLVGSIEVYDNETDELLDTFTVENEPLSGVSTLAADDTYLSNVSRTRTDNGLDTRLRARIEIYSSGSFRQINNVLNTQWFTGSGNHTIESATADSLPNGGQFPTTSIEVLGDATIQIATTQEFSAGWEAAGFSIGGSSGSTNYYRKYIELGFNYSLY